MEVQPISKAMLMAAGLGTRLRPFTEVTSKALMPVMGIPIAQFGISSLIESGVNTIVANTHHHSVQAGQELCALEHAGAEIMISDESKQLLGSAGGIRKALHHFGESPFFLANADVLCDVNWNALAAQHRRLRMQSGVQVTLAVFPAGPPGENYREIIFDPRSSLIQSLGSPVQGRPFFIGAAVLEPEAFQLLEEHKPAEFVPSILEPAIKTGKAGVYVTNGSWYDVGSPALWLETHLALIRRLERGNFPTHHSRGWRTRIERENRRLTEQVWISHGAATRLSRARWEGPCYWGGKGSEKKWAPPQSLGPNAILYGNGAGQPEFRQGIGYAGYWWDLEKKAVI
jgi:NDP-sugar pyrophosphorylase family protein